MSKKTKRLIIDPPRGWMYGFPKPVPAGCLKSDVLMKIWLGSEGYPSSLFGQALKYSRYWEEDVEE